MKEHFCKTTVNLQVIVGIKCSIILMLMALFMSTISNGSIRLKERTLEERVADADLIFVGKVIDKQVSGEWAKAKLVVEEPIAGVKKGDKIPVTWRVSIKGHYIYDTEEGLHGLVMLKNSNQHQSRYWFKGVKDIKLKAEVIAIRKAIDKKKLLKKVK